MADKPRFKEVLLGCAESSSLHGIPKIASSKQLAVKLLWCILLLGGICLCSYQVYEVFKAYYKYPIKTTIALESSKLDFPAITICNMNPIRKSKVSTDTTLYELLYGKKANKTDDDMLDGAFDQLNSLYDDYADLGNSTNTTNLTNTTVIQKDAYYVWRSQVLARFKELPSTDRDTMGHPIDIMLHSAKFGGYYHQPHEFQKVSSSEYGNCYTFDGLGSRAKGTGPRQGLQLVLNLETEEYLTHFSIGSGVRLVIHEQNTIPHPEEYGITLSPGYEMNIAMKMVQLERLSAPYGDCSDSYDDQGKVFTNEDCHKICASAEAYIQCTCIPYSLENFGKQVCKTSEQIACIRDTEETDCDCTSRCSETQYTTVLSGRQWPNANYLRNVLLKESCEFNHTSMANMCSRVANETEIHESEYYYYASNFLAVNIYYEQLNYQIIKEEPEYTEIQLLSDIGGTMGFYLGASVLTYVEFFQFLLEMALFCFQKKSSKTSPNSAMAMSEKS